MGHIVRSDLQYNNHSKLLLSYLKDIVICYDVSASDKIYGSHFDYHVFFIRYYLSQQLKKIKFITDGTFVAINIEIGEMSKPMEIFLCAIDYYAKIDKNVYDSLADYEKSIYVIGLVKEALIDISQTKHIPLDQLLNDCNELIKMGLVYRWTFRHIKIADLGLKIKFNCELNTYDFKLIATVYKDGEKKPFCEGCVIRTKPDQIHFSYISKKIQQKNGEIIFSSTWGREFFYLKISDLNKGIVKTIFSKTPYPGDLEATEDFLYLQKSLQYIFMVFCEFLDQVLFGYVVYQHFFSQLVRLFLWHLDLPEILVQFLSHIFVSRRLYSEH